MLVLYILLHSLIVQKPSRSLSKSLNRYVCFFCFNYSKYSRPSGLFKQIKLEKKEENGNYSYNVADDASSLALLSFIDIRRTIGISIQMN